MDYLNKYLPAENDTNVMGNPLKVLLAHFDQNNMAVKFPTHITHSIICNVIIGYMDCLAIFIFNQEVSVEIISY